MRLVVHEPGFVRITINCRSRSIPAGEALELVKLKGRVLPSAPKGRTSALDLTLYSVCGLMGESWWDQLAALDGTLTVGSV